ncbi:MAG: B12-binding domain-containing radical SAM protein [Nanoarchaeota archaeon]|nr:B12-binding domain-containing radical SAM protein [Nanoarchaeota archaeon]
MKILFIDPPFYRIIGHYNRYFPYGLTLLATVIKNAGYETLVYDADFITDKAKEVDISDLESSYHKYLSTINNNKAKIWEEMKHFIKKFSPDIVCLSCWTTYMASSFKVAEITKQVNNDIIIIAGGPHVTLKSDEVLKSKYIDYAVLGEGEDTLLELIKHINQSANKQPKDINGVYYKKNNIIKGRKRELKKNLNDIPIPNRSLLMHAKQYSAEDMGILMTTRGCPFSCSYCATSIWERKVRYIPINQIIKEIILIKKRYKTTHFSIKDDMFTINRERVKEFCNELIKRKLNITWDCNARVNFIDAKILRLMKRTGCTGIKIGIESGSEKILKLMNKQITREQIIKTSNILKKSGIHWTAYFMIGLPDETKKDMLNTLRLMKQVKPDYASLSVYEVFPETRLFYYGIELGLVKESMTIKDYFTIMPHNYYFNDGIRKTNTMSVEEFKKLEQYMKNEFEKYNKNIKNILKRINARKAMYLRNPMGIVVDFKKFIKWY